MVTRVAMMTMTLTLALIAAAERAEESPPKRLRCRERVTRMNHHRSDRRLECFARASSSSHWCRQACTQARLAAALTRPTCGAMSLTM